MAKKKKWKSIVPSYAVVPLLSCVGINFIVYTWIAGFADSWKHYNLELAFDRAVPIIPEFVSVYLGCYLFWIVNYILIARQGEEKCIRFATADILSRLICCGFFLLLPTTNVRPVIEGNGIWEQLLRFVYTVDAPTRLFPSIHCLVSWFCYIGIRGNKKIPGWYRIWSLICAILIFISTQVTKQHYIVDVFGGVIIAELTYYIAMHTEIWRGTARIFHAIERMTGKREKSEL